MAKLQTYKLNSTGNGDYNVTLNFDDSSTSTQTIHLGVLSDDALGKTAAQQLDGSVQVYADAYQGGLQAASVATPASITSAVGKVTTPDPANKPAPATATPAKTGP